MFQLRSFLNHQWCIGEGEQRIEEAISQHGVQDRHFRAREQEIEFTAGR